MPVEFKDYYQVLGVARDATEEDIKRAFRALARQYHPDVAKDKKNAEQKFKEINEAYEVLGDPESRKKFDELGANWKRGAGFQPSPGGDPRAWRNSSSGSGRDSDFHFGGTGFSDFFERFFGGSGRSREASGFAEPGDPEQDEAFGSAGAAYHGNDIEGNILVTLDEALHGSVRSVSLQHTHPQTGATGMHTFKVRIPPGVQKGKRIRIPGKGEPGIGGGNTGDLYLRVRYAEHPDFRVRGADLYGDLELAPWEAVLGATVSVATLDGPVSVRIPPGTNNAQQLRVRGYGLIKPKSGSRGNLYLIVSAQLPPSVSEEERGLWEQLAQKSKFNPRTERNS